MKKPRRYSLSPKDSRTELRECVIDAVKALPLYFKSPIVIQGLSATDLFSVNTLLGGAIEEQTVRILNGMRSVWDPTDRFFNYSFMRYPESFPDVRLVRDRFDAEPMIGIELKGWFLLSKEGEPSFRYKASANAMTEWDLLVCVPWALSEVLSGGPIAYTPYIEQAKYAADMRTYYWLNRKGSSNNRSTKITHPDTTPYPRAGSQYIDVPERDSGNNFGRIARIEGLMDGWVRDSLNIPLSGIETRYWIEFLSAFTEKKTEDEKRESIEKLVSRIMAEREEDGGDIEEITYHFQKIIEGLGA